MTTAERIHETLQHLPISVQEEVLDFAEFLSKKTEKGENGYIATGLQKTESIEHWVKRQSLQTPVILDDRREIIYED